MKNADHAQLLDNIALDIAKDVGEIRTSSRMPLYAMDSLIGVEATRRVALEIVPLVAALISISEGDSDIKAQAMARTALDFFRPKSRN